MAEKRPSRESPSKPSTVCFLLRRGMMSMDGCIVHIGRDKAPAGRQGGIQDTVGGEAPRGGRGGPHKDRGRDAVRQPRDGGLPLRTGADLRDLRRLHLRPPAHVHVDGGQRGERLRARRRALRPLPHQRQPLLGGRHLRALPGRDPGERAPAGHPPAVRPLPGGGGGPLRRLPPFTDLRPHAQGVRRRGFAQEDREHRHRALQRSKNKPRGPYRPS